MGAFIRGMARIFDFSRTFNRSNCHFDTEPPKSINDPWKQDADALKSDWQKVENDILESMNRIEQELHVAR